ncbi:MAG: zinc permease [Bacteroidota bacterium]
MALNFIVLLFGTFAGGMLVYWVKFKADDLRLPLIFAGTFLFSITVIHILPELFTVSDRPVRMGIFVLIGFFLQQFLEAFTSGVEHGHFHKEHATPGRTAGLMIALIVHSVLEGSLLTHGSHFHHHHESHFHDHESYSLLLGILFHKIPAAFALMAVIKTGTRPRVLEVVLLLIFSLASPMGILISNVFLSLSQETLLILFGVVSGSFLHISTTIFVESSPNHRLGLKRTIVSVVAATLAIAVEVLA